LQKFQPKIFFRRLSTRLIIIVSLVIFVAAGLFYFYVINLQRNLFQESFTRAAESTLETVKLGIEIGLENENYETINTVFDWAKQDKFLRFILLTDSENEIIAQYPDNLSLSLESILTKSSNPSLDDKLYIISTNWNAVLGNGNIYLGFSTEQIQNYESELLSDVGTVIIFALIIGILLVIVIATSITNPLENLRRITNKIRLGKLDSRADENRGGFEISSVAKDFNSMVHKLVDTQKALEMELNEAADFVKKLLPHHMIDPVRINWIFVPSLQLGGDSFGYNFIDDKHLAIYLIDVSGHGVGASLYSTTVLNILKEGALPNTNIFDPAEVLKSLNNTFQMEKYDEKYFTIWYGVLNTKNYTLTYSCAGHPPALLFRNENKSVSIIEIGINNMIIGGIPDIDYQSNKIELKKNDSLVIYSDGLYELRMTNNELLSINEFRRIITNNLESDSNLDDIISELQKITGRKHLPDDCSLIHISI